MIRDSGAFSNSVFVFFNCVLFFSGIKRSACFAKKNLRKEFHFVKNNLILNFLLFCTSNIYSRHENAL